MPNSLSDALIESALLKRMGTVLTCPESLPRDPFAPGESVVCALHPSLSMGQFPEFCHNHDYYELTYVRAGSFHQIIRETSILQAQGTLLLLNAGVHHRVWSENEDDVVINILVRRESMHRCFSQILSGNELLSHFLSDQDDRAYLLFPASQALYETMDEMIVESFTRRAYSSDMMQILLMKLLTTAVREYAPAPEKVTRADKKHRIREYIEKNLSSVCLTSLSERFGCSYRQMERIVREIYQKPFADAIGIQKIRAVQAYMAEGISAEDAAEIAGFSSASYYRLRLNQMKCKYPDL